MLALFALVKSRPFVTIPLCGLTPAVSSPIQRKVELSMLGTPHVLLEVMMGADKPVVQSQFGLMELKELKSSKKTFPELQAPVFTVPITPKETES